MAEFCIFSKLEKEIQYRVKFQNQTIFSSNIILTFLQLLHTIIAKAFVKIYCNIVQNLFRDIYIKAWTMNGSCTDVQLPAIGAFFRIVLQIHDVIFKGSGGLANVHHRLQSLFYTTTANRGTRIQKNTSVRIFSGMIPFFSSITVTSFTIPELPQI